MKGEDRLEKKRGERIKGMDKDEVKWEKLWSPTSETRRRYPFWYGSDSSEVSHKCLTEHSFCYEVCAWLKRLYAIVV